MSNKKHHNHDHGDTCSCGEHYHTIEKSSYRHEINTDDSGARPPRVLLKTKRAPGVVYIERSMHDEAIVVSGALTVITNAADIRGVIARELESAAAAVNAQGGTVGHIKASTDIITTEMISVTDQKAQFKNTPDQRVRIALAAIVFQIDPTEAEDIIRTALRAVRELAKKD